jgi:hypothetical protein
LLIVVLAPPALAILCDTDEDIADLQTYTYTLHHSPADLSYWRTYHMAQMMYGEFSDFKGNTGVDTTIEAGYYTSDGSLIYSVYIDCVAETWTSSLTNGEGVVETFQEGTLEKSCNDGDDMFDIWLKVAQPYMMNWLFNGQALQNGTQTTYYGTKARTRPLKVDSLYGAHKASTFTVTTTGTAILTRVASGQCITWPADMDSNCTAAANFVEARSKSPLAQFGANMVAFVPDCVNTIYYNWLQATVHPDRDSSSGEGGSAYCCCTYMETGKLYDEGCDTKEECKELYCMEDYLNACTQSCVSSTYDVSLIG